MPGLTAVSSLRTRITPSGHLLLNGLWLQGALGSGSEARVRLCQNPISNRKYSAYLYDPHASSTGHLTERWIFRHVELLREVARAGHPNIRKAYQIWYNSSKCRELHELLTASGEYEVLDRPDPQFLGVPPGAPGTADPASWGVRLRRYDGYVVFIADYCDVGPLSEFALRLSYRDISQVFHAVAGAVEALHARGIAHRDLKDANVLLSSTKLYPARGGEGGKEGGSTGRDASGGSAGTPGSSGAPSAASPRPTDPPSRDSKASGDSQREGLALPGVSSSDAAAPAIFQSADALAPAEAPTEAPAGQKYHAYLIDFGSTLLSRRPAGAPEFPPEGGEGRSQRGTADPSSEEGEGAGPGTLLHLHPAGKADLVSNSLLDPTQAAADMFGVWNAMADQARDPVSPSAFLSRGKGGWARAAASCAPGALPPAPQGEELSKDPGGQPPTPDPQLPIGSTVQPRLEPFALGLARLRRIAAAEGRGVRGSGEGEVEGEISDAHPSPGPGPAPGGAPDAAATQPPLAYSDQDPAPDTASVLDPASPVAALGPDVSRVTRLLATAMFLSDRDEEMARVVVDPLISGADFFVPSAVGTEAYLPPELSKAREGKGAPPGPAPADSGRRASSAAAEAQAEGNLRALDACPFRGGGQGSAPDYTVNLYAADVWSYGITLFYILTGVHRQAPLDRLSNDAHVLATNISIYLADLLCGCLTRDPCLRYTMREVVAHPFFLEADFRRHRDYPEASRRLRAFHRAAIFSRRGLFVRNVERNFQLLAAAGAANPEGREDDASHENFFLDAVGPIPRHLRRGSADAWLRAVGGLRPRLCPFPAPDDCFLAGRSRSRRAFCEREVSLTALASATMRVLNSHFHFPADGDAAARDLAIPKFLRLAGLVSGAPAAAGALEALTVSGREGGFERSNKGSSAPTGEASASARPDAPLPPRPSLRALCASFCGRVCRSAEDLYLSVVVTRGMQLTAGGSMLDSFRLFTCYEDEADDWEPVPGAPDPRGPANVYVDERGGIGRFSLPGPSLLEDSGQTSGQASGHASGPRSYGSRSSDRHTDPLGASSSFPGSEAGSRAEGRRDGAAARQTPPERPGLLLAKPWTSSFSMTPTQASGLCPLAPKDSPTPLGAAGIASYSFCGIDSIALDARGPFRPFSTLYSSAAAEGGLQPFSARNGSGGSAGELGAIPWTRPNPSSRNLPEDDSEDVFDHSLVRLFPSGPGVSLSMILRPDDPRGPGAKRLDTIKEDSRSATADASKPPLSSRDASDSVEAELQRIRGLTDQVLEVQSETSSGGPGGDEGVARSLASVPASSEAFHIVVSPTTQFWTFHAYPGEGSVIPRSATLSWRRRGASSSTLRVPRTGSLAAPRLFLALSRPARAGWRPEKGIASFVARKRAAAHSFLLKDPRRQMRRRETSTLDKLVADTRGRFQRRWKAAMRHAPAAPPPGPRSAPGRHRPAEATDLARPRSLMATTASARRPDRRSEAFANRRFSAGVMRGAGLTEEDQRYLVSYYMLAQSPAHNLEVIRSRSETSGESDEASAGLRFYNQSIPPRSPPQTSRRRTLYSAPLEARKDFPGAARDSAAKPPLAPAVPPGAGRPQASARSSAEARVFPEGPGDSAGPGEAQEPGEPSDAPGSPTAVRALPTPRSEGGPLQAPNASPWPGARSRVHVLFPYYSAWLFFYTRSFYTHAFIQSLAFDSSFSAKCSLATARLALLSTLSPEILSYATTSSALGAQGARGSLSLDAFPESEDAARPEHHEATRFDGILFLQNPAAHAAGSKVPTGLLSSVERAAKIYELCAQEEPAQSPVAADSGVLSFSSSFNVSRHASMPVLLGNPHDPHNPHDLHDPHAPGPVGAALAGTQGGAVALRDQDRHRSLGPSLRSGHLFFRSQTHRREPLGLVEEQGPLRSESLLPAGELHVPAAAPSFSLESSADLISADRLTGGGHGSISRVVSEVFVESAHAPTSRQDALSPVASDAEGQEDAFRAVNSSPETRPHVFLDFGTGRNASPPGDASAEFFTGPHRQQARRERRHPLAAPLSSPRLSAQAALASSGLTPGPAPFPPRAGDGDFGSWAPSLAPGAAATQQGRTVGRASSSGAISRAAEHSRRQSLSPTFSSFSGLPTETHWHLPPRPGSAPSSRGSTVYTSSSYCVECGAPPSLALQAMCEPSDFAVLEPHKARAGVARLAPLDPSETLAPSGDSGGPGALQLGAQALPAWGRWSDAVSAYTACGEAAPDERAEDFSAASLDGQPGRALACLSPVARRPGAPPAGVSGAWSPAAGGEQSPGLFHDPVLLPEFLPELTETQSSCSVDAGLASPVSPDSGQRPLPSDPRSGRAHRERRGGERLLRSGSAKRVGQTSLLSLASNLATLYENSNEQPGREGEGAPAGQGGAGAGAQGGWGLRESPESAPDQGPELFDALGARESGGSEPAGDILGAGWPCDFTEGSAGGPTTLPGGPPAPPRIGSDGLGDPSLLELFTVTTAKVENVKVSLDARLLDDSGISVVESTTEAMSAWG